MKLDNTPETWRQLSLVLVAVFTGLLTWDYMKRSPLTPMPDAPVWFETTQCCLLVLAAMCHVVRIHKMSLGEWLARYG